MGIIKRLNFGNIFLFLFFILFPFGQIIRIGIVQPLDIVAMSGGLYALFAGFKKPKFFKYFENFLFVASLTWIFSILIFRQVEVFYGLLYLLRLGAYFYFFLYVWNFTKTTKDSRKLLMDTLFSLSMISAFFGWIQYFLIPDLKPFFTWGWDEHLFRLVGTFLDPTFLGLIITFGLFIAIDRKKWFSTFFLLISLAFTYSRASYLAFLMGVIFLAIFKKMYKEVAITLFGLILLIFILPTARNHSVELFRSFSAIARIENYGETLIIFAKSPVFGVGYNNLCLARNKFIGPMSFSSHACSGSDSSLLFFLATMGVTGFFVFIYNATLVSGFVKKGGTSLILKASVVALLVHSLFSNSMFYLWILGYLIILLGVNLGDKAKG